MSAVNEVQSSLRIELESIDKTNQAIENFQRYHKDIRLFCFEEAANDASSEIIVQENLTRFLTILVAKVSNIVPYSYPLYFKFYDKTFVGLNEAKLLAQTVNNSKPTHVTFHFSHEVSVDAFAYLVSQCGASNNDTKMDVINRNKRRPRTTKFEFSGCGIQCKHAKALNQILTTSSMESLKILNTNISDNGAIALADALCLNTELISLNLNGHNKIGILGAQAFANMLCQNTCLESLSLYGKGIGDEGVAALGRTLQKNSSLKSLDISNIIFGNKGLLELAAGLVCNNSLRNLT